MKPQLILNGLLACLALLPPSTASAQAHVWTGPDAGGRWHDGANWTPASVPDATRFVVIDGETATPRVVTMDTHGAARSVNLSAGDTLRVVNGSQLQTAAEGYELAGLLELAAGGDNRLLVAANTVFTGAGELRLRGSSRLFGGGGSMLVSTAITGAGGVGWNEVHVTNQPAGRFVANVSGEVLSLDPVNAGAAPGFINQGALEASGGGILHLEGFGNGWFDNTGGTVTARDASAVRMLNSASLSAGTVTSEGSGTFRVLSGHHGYWTGVTNAGGTVVENNSWLHNAGTLTNSGSVTIAAAGHGTRLQLDAASTLTGPGSLVLGGGNAQIGGSHTLTHTGGHTMEGMGNAGINETAIHNLAGAALRATVSGQVLRVDPGNRGAEPGVVNRGVMQARDGGLLQLSGFGAGWFDNDQGLIEARDGSTVQLLESVDLRRGTLASAGTGDFRVLSGQSAYWSDLTHTATTVVENNSWLRHTGSLANSGRVTLAAGGNATRFHLEAPVTLSGSGRLVMGGGNAQIGGSQTLSHTGSHVIEGLGNAGINETAIHNGPGTLLQANVAGQVLRVDPGARAADPGFVNRSTMQARDGGILQLSGFGGGWFDNDQGVIRALDGSTVQMLESVDLRQGTLATEGTGGFRVLSGHNVYWTALHHTGRTAVENNAWLRYNGIIANTGVISLLAAGNSTRIQLDSDITLTGAGLLEMGGTNAHIGGGFKLTHAGGHTITGSGNAGLNEVFVENAAGALIEATSSAAALIVDPRSRSNDPGCINRGIMRARDGGVLHLSGFGGGWFDNTGGSIAAGDGSEVQFSSSASVLGGTLTSTGTGRFLSHDGHSTYWTALTHNARTLVGNNSWLRVNGHIQNTGAITLAAIGNSTRIQLEANATLQGPGELIMQGQGAGSNAHIGGGFLFTNDHHTIAGEGNIGINESALFNTAGSLIHANVSDRGLSLDPGGARLVTNRGTLRASGGGLMFLSGFGGGAFDNVNGVVEALDGSRVIFVNSPSFSGGVLRTAGSGVIELAAGNTMSLTSNTANTGLFHTLNNSTLYTAGLLNNTGTIRLTGEGNLTSLILSDNTTFTGGGIIHLDGNARIAGGAVLIVADQTIRGTGNIGWNESSISVGGRGLVLADVPGGTLTFDPAPIFGFTNDGILRAQNGGILNLSSFGGGEMFVGATGRMEALEGGRIQFDNNTNLMNLAGGTLTGGAWRVQGRTAATSLQLPGGTITTSAAVIELDGAQAQFAQLNGLTANNGTLTLANGASLSPAGAFTNAGALDIAAASAVNAAGAVTLTPSSSLTCHIGGTSTAGSLHSAAPAGSTAVAGKLTVVFDPGFTPAAGNSWPIISGPPTGTFSQFTVLGLPSSLRAALEYTPNFVNVTLTTRDGINFADWASTYAFATPEDAAPTADPDGDGLANLLEFALGAHPLLFESDAAPEPVIVTAGANQHLGLRYWKPAGASRRLGITYTPERSPAAATWTGSDIVLHSTVPADATGREQITVRHTAPLTARQLLRLRVTQP
jgi:fibronectin-binding autotransporter adhesin